MDKKQYAIACRLMRGIGAVREEQNWGEDAYDWEEYQKINQRLDELDWDLMAACGHNIEVRDHIEEAYTQRPTQPRRKRFFK